jgi:hypothetical protein
MARQPTAQLLPFPQADATGLRFVPQTGTWEEDQPDGSVLIHHRNPMPSRERQIDEHEANLAEDIDDDILNRIANDLIEAIEEDDNSRKKWLSMREKAITLLALEIEPPRSSAGSGGAVEGMSVIRHPLLLEASVRFQSNASGELLPADGPAKVANKGTRNISTEQGAVALEDATNVYLTDTCTEYYPDTRKALFQAGFSGAAIKKGYHCPIKRRPVIEAVDAKDFIIANTSTDIDSSPRCTHVIKMAPSVLRRMQIAGAYRDIDLSTPGEEQTELDRKIASTQGVAKSGNRPEDIDHTILECHCDYDLPGFEHEVDGEPSGLPLPYKIVIEKTSRQILEIRRNWRKTDESQRKRRTFVLYPFVPMFGFWPYGLLHLLGNTTNGITAAWRIILDNGMFNNFAAFLFAKGATNNETPNFTAGPGQGIPIDCPTGKLSDAVSPLPYKQTDPSFVQFVGDVVATGQRLGGTADVQVGEGKQDAPVGTTLALLEQATKIISAVHKGIHQAMGVELKMLRELLKEDPEALWRHREDGTRPENADLIIQALNDYDLIPVSDPNTPTHMHRLMKTAALAQRADTHPERYDALTVETEILRAIGWDNPEQFFAKAPAPGSQQPPAPDPNILKAMQGAHEAQLKASSALQIAAMRSQGDEANRALKAQDIASRERQTAAKIAADRQNKILDITQSLAVHPASMPIMNNGNEGLPQ